MKIAPFKLERYFAKYEFSVQYLLSSSDCESLSLQELLGMASPATRTLWDGLKLGYTESPGHPLLRQAIAGLYSSMTAANVVVAAPEECIFIAMQTLLSAGDHIISVTPTYQSLYEIAHAIGCSVTPWPLVCENGAWHLQLQTLEQSITRHTRLLVVNFPNNPTGFLPSLQELQDLIAIARKHNLFIFSDEMYRFLEYAPGDRLPSVCEIYDKGITLSGLSKSFSLPGLRIGWLVTREASLIPPWLAFKDYTTICNSAPSEILALMALENRDTIVATNLEIIAGNLQIAKALARRFPGLFTWIPPKAGSMGFPQLSETIPAEQFCQELREQHQAMIVPGTLFDFPGNHFRLGLGRKNFPRALKCIETYAENLPR